MLPPDYLTQRAVAAPERSQQERHLEHLRGLRERLAGSVVSIVDAGWGRARLAWNLAADQRPPLVAYPETIEDVAELVAFARARGLRLAPQGTGHGAVPLGRIEDAILVTTSRLKELVIDPGRQSARVGAGVTWGELQEAAASHGLAGLAGSSPDVGVVGYTLGGGLGWLGRRYGLACNSVLAIEVVTVDGRVLRANEHNEPELFWALRGGGGSFGIVTALEFALYPVRRAVCRRPVLATGACRGDPCCLAAWTADIPDAVHLGGSTSQRAHGLGDA